MTTATAGARTRARIPWDLSDPRVFDHGIPHEAFRALRALDGLAWNPIDGSPTDGFWSVGRLDDVAAVSRDADLFSSAKGHVQIYTIEEDALAARASMIDMDPPEHTRLRRIVSPYFVPRAIQKFVPFVRRRAADLLDALVADGGGDWAARIAKPIPIGVICDILGVPEEDHDYMVELTDALVGGTSGEAVDPSAYGNTTPLRLLPFNHPAAHALREYARRLGEVRRAAPRDDLVSRLVSTSADGERLDDGEFTNFFRLLVFAGNETTRTAMSYMAMHLAQYPEQFERVRRDRALVAGAVEEVVRFASPIYHFRRTATRDTELSGTPIAKGEKVVMWYASANFDERHFDDAQRFDVARPVRARHVAYGSGVHTCLGAALARLELAELLNEILDRDLRVEIDRPPRHVRSNFANGIVHLDVKISA
jgi:cholest-4-en-3-one 26-monooxygenase